MTQGSEDSNENEFEKYYNKILGTGNKRFKPLPHMPTFTHLLPVKNLDLSKFNEFSKHGYI